MANKMLIGVGIIIIILGVAQWILLSQLGVLSLRVSGENNQVYLVDTVGAQTSKSIVLYSDPINDPLYIPFLAYPKFYVVIGISGRGITSAADVSDVFLDINLLDSNTGQSIDWRFGKGIVAEDHVFDVNKADETVYLRIEIVDSPEATGYSLTVSNNKNADVTILVYEFGVKTETRNFMLILIAVGIIDIIGSFILSARAGASKKRRRKAFYAMEEEPTLLATGTGASVSKSVKKKKKKKKVVKKKVSKAKKKVEEATCKYCGQPIQPGAFFCPNCYAELR